MGGWSACVCFMLGGAVFRLCLRPLVFFIYLSVHLSFICFFIYLWIFYLSIPINLFIYLSICLYFYLCIIYLFISINQSICLYFHLSIIYLSVSLYRSILKKVEQLILKHVEFIIQITKYIWTFSPYLCQKNKYIRLSSYCIFIPTIFGKMIKRIKSLKKSERKK